MRAFGIFHRLESGSQTVADALQQVASGEIWGKSARFGCEPAVKAYSRNFSGSRGIEFSTDIEPHDCGSPLDLFWYLTKTPSVLRRVNAAGEEYACITAEIQNNQPYEV